MSVTTRLDAADILAARLAPRERWMRVKALFYAAFILGLCAVITLLIVSLFGLFSEGRASGAMKAPDALIFMVFAAMAAAVGAVCAMRAGAVAALGAIGAVKLSEELQETLTPGVDVGLFTIEPLLDGLRVRRRYAETHYDSRALDGVAEAPDTVVMRVKGGGGVALPKRALVGREDRLRVSAARRSRAAQNMDEFARYAADLSASEAFEMRRAMVDDDFRRRFGPARDIVHGRGWAGLAIMGVFWAACVPAAIVTAFADPTAPWTDAQAPQWASWIILGLAGSFVFSSLVWRLRRLNAAWSKAALGVDHGGQIIRLGAGGVAVERALTLSRFEWAGFCGILETPRLFVLRFGALSAVAIPKRCVSAYRLRRVLRLCRAPDQGADEVDVRVYRAGDSV